MLWFYRKGHDAGDHPPITPMRLATHNELDGDAWRIYDYVVRHFIATVAQVSISSTFYMLIFLYESALHSFSLITVWLFNFLAKEYRRKSCFVKCWWNWLQNCKYQSTMIYFKIGQETFSFTGKKLLDPGQDPFNSCDSVDAISIPP